MPRTPYPGPRDERVEAICERLVAGATLKEICREPGTPPWHTVMRWQGADPAVKARLHAARGWSYQRDAAAREGAIRRLCEQLSRGWTLRRACGEPQAPSWQTIHNWTRDDPNLRERLRNAQAWGVQFRPRYNEARFFYDYTRVDRFLARVRQGEGVAAMQATHEAPHPEIIRAWKRMRPEFVEQYAVALRAGAAVRRARPRRPFDQDVADRIVVRVTRGATLAALMREDGMPGLTALNRWRRREPDLDMALRFAVRGGRRHRARARAGPTPSLTRRIGVAIAGGATIEALCARRGMPHRNTFYAWRRLYPAFAEEITAALDHRAWMAAEETLERAKLGTPQWWRALHVSRG